MALVPGRLAVVVALVALLGACSDTSDPATSGAGGTAGAGGATGSGAAGGAAGGPSYPDPYTAVAFDAVRISSHSDQPNYQQASAEVDLGSAPYQAVKLVVDLATTCYPFETWQDNPPPEGENWPADCDAFDRNFEIVLDEPAMPGEGPPGIELLHAITPFGGPLHLEVDITDVANGAPGPHKVSVVIPTYSDAAGQVSGSNGGWNVSAKFEVTPGPAPRPVLAVVPITRAVQTTAVVPAAELPIPDGATSMRLEYRASGHGGAMGAEGCIGPAEEFCHRTHTLSLDDAPLGELDAWRTDCKDLCTLTHYGPTDGGFDYCLENPCGAISSVKAPRANWCPGSVTQPLVFEQSITAGAHTFSWAISTVIEGGSWRIAAHAIVFAE